MPSTRFLQRAAEVLESRVEERRRNSHPLRQRLLALGGGLLLAGAAFFLLKGAAIAAGAALPGAEGAALWLAGPDPVAAALGSVLQPLFALRG